MDPITVAVAGSDSDHFRPLLACGHYGEDTHRASSQWDFPDEPQHCEECGGLRQLDLWLQCLLHEERPAY